MVCCWWCWCWCIYSYLYWPPVTGALWQLLSTEFPSSICCHHKLHLNQSNYILETLWHCLQQQLVACRWEWFDICAINTHWHCCSFTLSTHCHELYLSWLVEFVNWKGGIDFTGLYPPNSPDNDIAMHCGTFMHANSNHLTLPHQDQAYKLWMESIGNPVEKCPVPFNTSSGR